MIRLFYTILLLAVTSIMMAQQPMDSRPKRTPAEIAHKQTEMMVRELGLTDSLQRDTLFRLHLKYARMRVVSNTRAEELERTQAFYRELKQVLSKAQFEAFMNMQVTHGPRQPQQVCRMHGPAEVSSTTPAEGTQP